MGRAPCCDKNGLKKGPWTPEEDQKLIDYIQKNGCGNWRTLPKNAGLQRCGKSCRLRWTNYLRPDIKRGKFSFEEEETIIQLHSILGNKWSAIAARLPGRTDNEIKNYWNTHIRKRLLRMGIDPVTHSPRLDLLDISAILNSSLYGNNNLTTSSQFNFSRLLGVQQLINPDLIRLLFPNKRNYNQDFLMQHPQDNSSQPLTTDHDINSIPTLIGSQPCNEMKTPVQDLSTTYCHDDNDQLMQYGLVGSQYDECQVSNISDQWRPKISNGPMLNSTNVSEDYTPVITDYGYYGQDRAAVDQSLSSESSNFNSNLTFQSAFSNRSSPSLIPAPLNSNSTYAEDERESYCSSNMLKFEMQDIWDVNDFM